MKGWLRQIFHIDHFIVAAFTIIIIELMVLVTINLDFLSPIVRALESFSMTDVYYKIQNRGGQQDMCNTITLVDMTELKHRSDIAKVISDIKAMRPKALGVDIIFEGELPEAGGDEALAEACLTKGGVKQVLACKLTDYDEDAKTFHDSRHSFFAAGYEQLGSNAEGDLSEGFINLIDDPAKSIKKYAVTLPYRDSTVLSLPAQIVQAVAADSYTPGEVIHTISYKPVSFPIVKYDELADYQELIKDHIVLLGTTQAERDKYYTPIGQKSGMEILAYTILSMTEHNPIRHADRWMVLLWALIAGYLTNLIDFLLTKRIERRRSTIMIFITQSEFYDKLISFFVMVLVTWASFELYARYNYFVDTVLALSTVVLIEEGRLLYVGLLSALKQKTKWRLISKSIYSEDLED